MKKGLTLKRRVMLSFFAVTAGIIALFFLTNALFWKVIILRINRDMIESVYVDIAEQVKSGNTTSKDLLAVIDEHSSSSTLYFARHGDSDWEFNLITREIISQNQQRFLLERLQDDFLNSNPNGVSVLKKTGDYTLQHVVLPKDGSEYFELYGFMQDQQGDLKKFILSMPLQRTKQVYRFSNQFFMVISVFILIVGTILIIIITNRVTKPIRQLTDLSDRMKNMDFSARYTGDKTDEIGVLGNNMNEMASQLERTILKLQLANDQLSKDLKEQEHIDEMRKDFISNVSHELKTPIALIQGYAEGLKDTLGDPESFNYYCDVIADETDKMSRMVKKLTTLNQLEFGTAEFTPVTFDIIEMVRSVIRQSSKQIRDASATVLLDGPKELLVVGDEFEIEEVVNNYFSNALHHLEAPNEIRFRVENLGPTARISVENTGNPIPEDELQKVWIKFYKVDRARTRTYGGSGIGLSIVKAIMEAHHQEYGVYNTDCGVTFWFELQTSTEEPDGCA